MIYLIYLNTVYQKSHHSWWNRTKSPISSKLALSLLPRPSTFGSTSRGRALSSCLSRSQQKKCFFLAQLFRKLLKEKIWNFKSWKHSNAVEEIADFRLGIRTICRSSWSPAGWNLVQVGWGYDLIMYHIIISYHIISYHIYYCYVLSLDTGRTKETPPGSCYWQFFQMESAAEIIAGSWLALS